MPGRPVLSRLIVLAAVLFPAFAAAVAGEVSTARWDRGSVVVLNRFGSGDFSTFLLADERLLVLNVADPAGCRYRFDDGRLSIVSRPGLAAARLVRPDACSIIVRLPAGFDGGYRFARIGGDLYLYLERVHLGAEEFAGLFDRPIDPCDSFEPPPVDPGVAVERSRLMAIAVRELSAEKLFRAAREQVASRAGSFDAAPEPVATGLLSHRPEAAGMVRELASARLFHHVRRMAGERLAGWENVGVATLPGLSAGMRPPLDRASLRVALEERQRERNLLAAGPSVAAPLPIRRPAAPAPAAEPVAPLSPTPGVAAAAAVEPQPLPEPVLIVSEPMPAQPPIQDAAAAVESVPAAGATPSPPPSPVSVPVPEAPVRSAFVPAPAAAPSEAVPGPHVPLPVAVPPAADAPSGRPVVLPSGPDRSGPAPAGGRGVVVASGTAGIVRQAPRRAAEAVPAQAPVADMQVTVEPRPALTVQAAGFVPLDAMLRLYVNLDGPPAGRASFRYLSAYEAELVITGARFDPSRTHGALDTNHLGLPVMQIVPSQRDDDVVFSFRTRARQGFTLAEQGRSVVIDFHY